MQHAGFEQVGFHFVPVDIGQHVPVDFDTRRKALPALFEHLSVVEQIGVAIADGQLWNAFHNCPYGKFPNMESPLPEGSSNTLIIRFLWVTNALNFFP